MSDAGKPKVSTLLEDRNGYLILGTKKLTGTNCQIEIITKESINSRFVEIVHTVGSVQRHFTVSMCHLNTFISKIREMIPFVNVTSSRSVNPKHVNRTQRTTLKTEMNTSERRKYYFELIMGESVYFNISCVRENKRRVTIILPFSITSDFLLSCEEMIKNFPDLPRSNPADNRHHHHRRDHRFNTNGYSLRNNHPDDHDPEHSGSHRRKALEVLAKPVPRQMTLEEKSFVLEVVKGDNTFLRITEFIRDRIKKSIHVPINVMGALAHTITEMDKEVKQS
ncbi:hypothetical protein RF11_15115 [Thelohanellus kitauei]|uniref:Uncharacterized protein n=1 Tax=Thelohanellus kitauei TaxID=669202 RepID=A0A0C2MU57_THEKT|nr:hypothetical protein RF11_15115 [Thelohanellus kitauei]